MKRLLLLISFLSILFSGMAQEKAADNRRDERKRAKLERKAAEKAEMEKMAGYIKFLLENQRFVLEVDFLKTMDGPPQSVDPSTNFIYMDSAKCTIQLSAVPTIGSSVTYGTIAEGNVGKYRVSAKGKKMNTYSVDFNSSTSTGLLIIHINVSSSGSATATVKNPTLAGKLTYTGMILSHHDSKIFSGFLRK